MNTGEIEEKRLCGEKYALPRICMNSSVWLYVNIGGCGCWCTFFLLGGYGNCNNKRKQPEKLKRHIVFMTVRGIYGGEDSDTIMC